MIARHLNFDAPKICKITVYCKKRWFDSQWGPWASHQSIQTSMEAILACHPALSTEWLDWVAISRILWHMHTAPIAPHNQLSFKNKENTTGKKRFLHTSKTDLQEHRQNAVVRASAPFPSPRLCMCRQQDPRSYASSSRHRRRRKSQMAGQSQTSTPSCWRKKNTKRNFVKQPLLQTGCAVSAYVSLISAVQTLEQTHGKSKLYTTCLDG